MWLGAALGILLLGLVLAGPALAPHNPFATATRLLVEGEYVAPPLGPSALFPWGTDAQGRDIQSLVLAGARRTLTIALLAMLARLALGSVLGFGAGWFHGQRLERAIMGVAEIMAAFPALLLTMLIVYALGIREGLSAFVVALACTGWGEVMQTVRGQVLAIRPMPYIEGARAAGVQEGQILSAHVLPNVWPTLVSLAFLELGGVLMLLGELGFLGVFIGGGFAAEGDAYPTLIYYDVPEWSVMLANSWRYFRAYPWTTLAPALAFFLAILGFTLLSEGLRRLSERLTLSFHGFFNRYALLVVLLVAGGIYWTFWSTSYETRFAPLAQQYDAARALEDVRALCADEYRGRLSATAEADAVATWIAAEFARLGLQRGGVADTYFQPFADQVRDLSGPPTLTLFPPQGEPLRARYGEDFTRDYGPYEVGGQGQGEVTFIAQRPDVGFWYDSSPASLGLSEEEAARPERILLRLNRASADELNELGKSGLLTVSALPLSARYELLATHQNTTAEPLPALLISTALANRILAQSGRSVEQLAAQLPTSHLQEGIYLPTGWRAEINVPSVQREGVVVRNVIGVWPGEDVALDKEAIFVAAHYDGLGAPPGGAVYAGANDNASGVATLLEVIRTLKAQQYRPKRTLIFVAWCGAERHRSVDYAYFLKARPGQQQSKIVAGVQVQGVGAGTGNTAVLEHATRGRLTEVVQRAARRVGTPLSTRGKGLHANARWSAPSATIPSLTLSWQGSDAFAHTPQDTPATLDPTKMAHTGRTLALAVMLFASDPAY